MNPKILAPFMLALSAAPAAFAYPGARGSSGRPTTVVTTIAKGVVTPVATTVVKGVTLPVTVAAKVAQAMISPTTFVVNTTKTSTVFTGNGAKAPSATYIPSSKKDDSRADAKTQMPPNAVASADESNDRTMIVEEQPMFRTTDACDKVSVQSIDFVTIPSRDTSLKNDQSTATAANGTMELYPKANGKFIRQKRINKDAFVVSFEGRWLRHRKTFRLDHDAVVYQGNELTKIDFLQRGDPVEVAFLESNNKFVAVAVESNRTGEYVASR